MPAVGAKPAVRHFLVLPAAGNGQRMQAAQPKQYLEVAGKSLLQHTLERVGGMECFARIVVALAADDREWPVIEARLPAAIRNRLVVATGGAERCRSVANALAALGAEARADDWVLVHDAVRPCVHADDVTRLLAELRDERAGGLLATPLRETLKEADAEGRVSRTLDRRALWLAATPQMFRFAVLQRALQAVLDQGQAVTDEAAAVEGLGLPVRLVRGRGDNIKVTYPEDLELVAALLAAQAERN